MLITDTEQKKRWAEHFRHSPQQTVNFNDKMTILPINVGQINEIQINEAINSLAKNKAAWDSGQNHERGASAFLAWKKLH